MEGTDQVLEVFREFYQSLYKKHDGSIRGGFEWLFSFPAQNSQSSSEVKGDRSGVVTFETVKLKESLKRMSANKAPGPDLTTRVLSYIF